MSAEGRFFYDRHFGQPWKRWKDAWRGLKHNPLPQYWALRERRRRKRTAAWPRRALYLLGAGCGVVFSVIAGLSIYQSRFSNYSWYHGGSVSHTSANEQLFWLLAIGALAVHAVALCLVAAWVLSGLFNAHVQAIGLLSVEPERRSAEGVDCGLALCLLSDPEMLLGLLKHLLPPLLGRLCLLAWLVCSALAWHSWYTDHMTHWERALRTAPLFNPETAAMVLLCAAALTIPAALACLSMLLLMLILGRLVRQQSARVLFCALGLALQVAWGIFNWMLLTMYDSTFVGLDTTLVVGNCFIGAATFTVWMILISTFGSGRPWFIGLPVMLFAGGVFILPALSYFGLLAEDIHTDWIALGTGDALWALSGLNIFNPMTMLTPDLLGPLGYHYLSQHMYGDAEGLATPLRQGMLILLQLLYVSILFYFARDALRRWRRSEE